MLEVLVVGETLIILRVGDCKALEVVGVLEALGFHQHWVLVTQSWLWGVPTACVHVGAGERNSLPSCAPNVEMEEHISPSFLGVAGSVMKMRAAFRVVTR